jgi:hypothetical protein
MVLGLVIVVAGLFLAILPLQAARVTHWARFAGYSSETGAVRYYRVVGVVMAAIHAAWLSSSTEVPTQSGAGYRSP